MERQAHHALADAVVDLARQPPPFGFLGTDDPLGEPFHGFLTLGQPAVQPRVLDSTGHQARHRAQQLHVGVVELAALARMHVEHADQVARLAQDGHGDHRRELFSPQRGDVLVPVVGALVRDDDGRLAVGRDPARHPLADLQFDLPGEPVERRGGAPQHEPLAILIEQVHEAHVGVGGLGHERCDPLENPVQVKPGRDRLDDPDEQPRLPHGIGEAEAAQWKIPSRRAAATAPARSVTSSLR